MNERIKQELLTNGFFVIEDPHVAVRVRDFAEKKYPFQNEEGLAFLDATLSDQRVTHTVESTLAEPGLGWYKAVGPHPDTARALLNWNDKVLALVFFHCREGSKLLALEKSHQYDWNATPGGTGILECPRTSMRRPGVREKAINLNDGGLLIVDGRFWTSILEGTVIQVGFASQEELAEWGKMRLPDLENIKAMVNSMERENIKFNFKYIKPKE